MRKIILINMCEEHSDNRLVAGLNLPRQVPVGPHFPIGLISIASYLKKKIPRVFIKILNEQIYSFGEIKKELTSVKPDIVGIGCAFKDYSRALKLARLAKIMGAKVLIGGHHATALRREIVTNRGPGSSDYCVDAVVQQDGEDAFYKYVSGKPPKGINNLVYWHKGGVIENPVNLIRLDSLPFLNIGLVDTEDYFREYQKRFPDSEYKRPALIYSQKGCSWRRSHGGCLFCSLMEKKIRLRHPKNVWNDIDKLVRDYDVDYIWDVSDSFLNSKTWFKKFYEESRHRIKKPFLKIYARASDLTDENIIKMLVDLNVVQIFVGFESNDDVCLAKINKGTNSQMNEKAVSLLGKYKVEIRGFFVLGMPGETKESLAKTAKLAEKILQANTKNLVFMPVFIPLAKSPAYNLLLKKTGNKYIGKDDIDWAELVSDWLKNFCSISHKDILKVRRSLQTFPYDISSYSY